MGARRPPAGSRRYLSAPADQRGERIAHLRTPHGERVHASTEARRALTSRCMNVCDTAGYRPQMTAIRTPLSGAGPESGSIAGPAGPDTRRPAHQLPHPAALLVPQRGAGRRSSTWGTRRRRPQANTGEHESPQKRRVLEDHAVADPHRQEIGPVVHVVGADPLFEARLPPGLLGSALVGEIVSSPARGRASRVPSPHTRRSHPNPSKGSAHRCHAGTPIGTPWLRRDTLWALTVSGVQRSRSWTSTVPPTMPARGSRANVSATQAK